VLVARSSLACFGRWFASAAIATALCMPIATARAEAFPRSAPGSEPARIVELGVGVELAGRRFAYTDALTGNLRPYDLFPAALVGVTGELFPFARTHGLARGLGLSFDYASALGLSSVLGDERITTRWNRLGLDVHARFWPNGTPGPRVGAALGFGWTRFDFDAARPLSESLPAVSYRYLRAGLETRLPAGPVSAMASLGYRGVLSGGATYDRFRAHTLAGVDASLGVALPLGRGFEAELAATYTRYFATFSPEPGDAYIAGGAIDELLGLRLSVTYGDGAAR
jgi:hypothetical protein